MHSAHVAFEAFQRATRDLHEQPEPAQIHILKRELYRALEQAADLQTRNNRLELKLQILRDESRDADPFAANLTQRPGTA